MVSHWCSSFFDNVVLTFCYFRSFCNKDFSQRFVFSPWNASFNAAFSSALHALLSPSLMPIDFKSQNL